MPKRIQPLSDTQIKNAKPKGKDFKLSDGFGLYLLVTPTGGKLWRMQYRFAGKQKLLSFGSYPSITLTDARQRREDARKLLANGVDPLEVKRAQKKAEAATIARAENTFEKVAREWHGEEKHRWSENHAGRLLRRLEVDIFPSIGAKPITDIRTPEMEELLKRVALRTLETAHRLKIACDKVFKYAIRKEIAANNPVAPLTGVLPTVKYTHMAAPTEPKKVAEILRAIDGFSGSFVVKIALQLAPLLFCRPGELRAMEWAEIDFDGKKWNIPGHKMKMKKTHIVPLSKRAIDLLKQIQPLTGSGKYVFPCHRTPLRCMSENAVNAGLRRLGFEKEEVTGHGFRAMARTMLHELLNFNPDVIEAQLAHKVPDRLGEAYNRTSFIEQRKKMMETWADYLDGLKQGAKVLPLKRRSES